MSWSLSTLAIWITGGPLSPESDKRARRAPRARSEDVINKFTKKVANIVTLPTNLIRVSRLCTGDSTDLLTGKDRIAMAEFVDENEKDPNVLGTVLIHGAQTMAETGAYLAAALGNWYSKNVVITGSQSWFDDVGSDAQANISLAVKALLAWLDSERRTPLLVYWGQIMPAINVTMSNKGPRQLFDQKFLMTPQKTGAAVADEISDWLWLRKEIPTECIDFHAWSCIDLVRVIDADADSIHALHDAWEKHTVHGIIIRARGTGQIASNMVKYIEQQMKIRPIFVGAVADIPWTVILWSPYDNIHYLGAMTDTTARHKLANVLSRLKAINGVAPTDNFTPFPVQEVTHWMIKEFTTHDFSG